MVAGVLVDDARPYKVSYRYFRENPFVVSDIYLSWVFLSLTGTVFHRRTQFVAKTIHQAPASSFVAVGECEISATAVPGALFFFLRLLLSNG